MSSKSKRKGRYSSLDVHRKSGSTLLPRLADPKVNLIDFERDLLPEHLWIAALADRYGLDAVHRPYEDMMDAIDTVWPESEPTPIGFISDFGEVPLAKRSSFLQDHAGLVRAAFLEPVGRLLAFYPECPAGWMLDKRFLEIGGPLDPDLELARLRGIVVKLMAAKDNYAGHIRLLPVTRPMKHGKIHIASSHSVADILPRYPHDCTEDERYIAQSFGRTQVNMSYLMHSRYSEKRWPKHFWRQNINLTNCQRFEFPLRGSVPITRDQVPVLEAQLAFNAQSARVYLDRLASQSRPDLYAPERDEVLFGLISRAIRLFVLIAEDPNLWARDTAGIMLRCLADTVITFAYLVRAGTDEDFRLFVQYGEGQAKLLMLHLQDSYPLDRSLDGRTSKAIADELGFFTPELIPIELGSWSKMDTRKLAQKAGFERLYRLVFNPTSSDVHGTWLSLKHSNLLRCGEPLHRFHRLPAYVDPPVFVNTLIAAQELILECAAVGVEDLNYPEIDPPFHSLDEFLATGTEPSDAEQEGA
ncbi:MAG TPA: DUF5677 domain-containing protein [Phycisphaerae bacterium]|nr:DUF5677 domain-containing protein [Phycisphaerae bacterium]